MRCLALVALLLLTGCMYGCAGTARYSVKPFYEPNTKKVICCEASAFSAKDISSLTFDLSMLPDSTVTVHFSEAGVSASLPMTANGQTASAISGAVTTAIDAGLKFSLKP
jgi:hypothetical protein